MTTPIKMSQFEAVASLTTGSYIPTLESASDGSGYANQKILATDLVTYISSTKWQSVPASSGDAGTQGDMAISNTGVLYIYTNGAWWQFIGTTGF